MPRVLVAVSICAVFLATRPATPQQQAPEEETIPTIERTTVTQVVAPVTVLDRGGNYVNGLQPQQFHLFDNGKEQDIKVDVAFQPISMVIAVQANDHVEAILPQIQKIGNLIEPLVIGEQGEAAVLAFDHRFRIMQDFTSDSDKIAAAVKKIKAGSSQSRLIDAVGRSIQMLRNRPQNRRRIILLISETRDKGSESRVREALNFIQVQNVSLFSVDVSRFLTTLSAKEMPPRPDPLPPAMHPLPPNVPATPNNVQQGFGTQGQSANFIPLFVEIFKDTKAIFIDNPVEVFTKGTGGAEFPFYKQRGLEEAISKIGEEIHSQYLISYNPNNKNEGGFHEIKVELNRSDVKIRTRPGYWMASVIR